MSIKFAISPMGPGGHYKIPSPTGSLGFFDDNKRLMPDLWERYVRMVKNCGGTHIRLFQFKWHFECSPGKWDLAIFNRHIFDDVKQMIAIAKKYNITIIISLFSNSDFSSGRIGPWTSNLQGKTFYKSIDHSLAVVRKCFAEFGNTIEYEICNEPMFGANGDQWKKPVKIGSKEYYCFADEGGKHRGWTYAELKKLGIQDKFGNVYWFAMMWRELIKLGVKSGISGCRFNYDKKTLKPDTLTSVYGAAGDILKWYGLTYGNTSPWLQCIHGAGGVPGNDRTPFALAQYKATDKRPICFISTDQTLRKVLDPTGKYLRWERQTPEQLYQNKKLIFKNMADGKILFDWYLENLTHVDLVPSEAVATNKAYWEIFGADLPGWGSEPPLPEPEPEPIIPPVIINDDEGPVKPLFN